MSKMETDALKRISISLERRGIEVPKSAKALVKETVKFVKNQIIAEIENSIDEEVQGFEENLELLLDEWSASVNIATGGSKHTAFPEGIKFATCKGNDAVFVIEQKPQVRSVIGQQRVTYRLAFPYLVFVVHFHNTRYQTMAILARNAPLSSLNDEVFHLVLSNIYKPPFGTGLCMNNNIPSNGSLEEKINSIISGFWQTAFFSTTSHVARQFAKPTDKRLASWASWEAETVKDPSFILDVNWPQINKGGTNLGGIIKAVMRNKNRANAAKNKFRPTGKALSQRVRNLIVNIGDSKADEKDKSSVAKDLDNPMFRKKVIKVGKGRKQCECGKVVGARARKCECGYDFKLKANPKLEQEQNAAGKVQELVQKRAKPEPVAPKMLVRKIPKPIKLKIKKLVAAAKKKLPVKLGKGRKLCPACENPTGSRTRVCECGHKFY